MKGFIRCLLHFEKCNCQDKHMIRLTVINVKFYVSNPKFDGFHWFGIVSVEKKIMVHIFYYTSHICINHMIILPHLGFMIQPGFVFKFIHFLHIFSKTLSLFVFQQSG